MAVEDCSKPSNELNIRVPHQPRHFEFPRREFGNSVFVRRSFQPSWFDRWSSVVDPGISGGGGYQPSWGSGGAVSPPVGSWAKLLATKLNAISCLFYYILTD